MKKTLFVMVVAAVLVFAFATAAMAGSPFPANRSSAFLAEEDAENRVLASGGLRDGYISWTIATDKVTDAQTLSPSAATTAAADAMLLGPHSGYTMGTMKCQVCHSAHKALIEGTDLTPGTGAACVSCHGAGSAFSKVQVSAGSSLDNRHGSSCTTLCHTMSPHGGNVSKYPVAASALLHKVVDPVIDAAVQSGSTGIPQFAYYQKQTGTAAPSFFAFTGRTGAPATPVTTTSASGGTLSGNAVNYGDAYIQVFQPTLKGDEVTALNAPTTDTLKARGRAIVTGYVCGNAGCHINGSFNGLRDDAFYGEWRFRAAGPTGNTGDFVAPDYVNYPGTEYPVSERQTVGSSSSPTPKPRYGGGYPADFFMPMGNEAGAAVYVPDTNLNADGNRKETWSEGYYGPSSMRTRPIKGHSLFTSTSNPDFNGGTTPNTNVTAWATSGTCKSCHDQADPRIGNKPAFPHSNAYWQAGPNPNRDRTAVDYVVADVPGATAGTYYKTFNTAAWFMVASEFGATPVPTNTRYVDAASATFQQLTVGMDGACLKCHQNSSPTLGVGKSY